MTENMASDRLSTVWRNVQLTKWRGAKLKPADSNLFQISDVIDNPRFRGMQTFPVNKKLRDDISSAVDLNVKNVGSSETTSPTLFPPVVKKVTNEDNSMTVEGKFSENLFDLDGTS